MNTEDDEIYKVCPSCGKLIKWDAVICTYCGIQVKELKVDVSYNPKFTENLNPAKSKAIAIVLAIFFGYWSWLYAYKVNKGKFWFFLIADILRYAYISQLIIPKFNMDFYSYNQFSSEFYIALLLSSILTIITWLWALISNYIKSNSFYINYPNG